MTCLQGTGRSLHCWVSSCVLGFLDTQCLSRGIACTIQDKVCGLQGQRCSPEHDSLGFSGQAVNMPCSCVGATCWSGIGPCMRLTGTVAVCCLSSGHAPIRQRWELSKDPRWWLPAESLGHPAWRLCLPAGVDFGAALPGLSWLHFSQLCCTSAAGL